MDDAKIWDEVLMTSDLPVISEILLNIWPIWHTLDIWDTYDIQYTWDIWYMWNIWYAWYIQDTISEIFVGYLRWFRYMRYPEITEILLMPDIWDI